MGLLVLGLLLNLSLELQILTIRHRYNPTTFGKFYRKLIWVLPQWKLVALSIFLMKIIQGLLAGMNITML